MKIVITTKDEFAKYANYYQESEPLFLDPDGTRTRFPIGWKGVGRYLPGTLQVYTASGEKVSGITEEDGGVFFNFSSAPSAGSYKDYVVKYVPRPDDVAFSKGLSNSSFPGEEYFLFPNRIDGPGIGDAFWIGKYQASRSDATTSSQGSSTILASRKNVCPVTNVAFSTWNTLISNKGSRFHQITNREWSNVILWSLKMGIKITGNCYGLVNSSYVNIDGEGTNMTQYPADGYYKTRTGMGPNTWNHNGLEGGIADMCGNVWEATDGLKLVNNVIYIFDNDTDKNWVSTGVAYSGNLITNSSGSSFGNTLYYPTDSDLWKEMIPCNASGKETITAYGDDGTWFSSGERILYRGGGCYYGSLAGVFAFLVSNDYSHSYWGGGCRLCVKLL